MSAQNLPPSEPARSGAEPRVVAGVYRDGVVHPAEPLGLPPGSPVDILIVAGAPAPAATSAPAPQLALTLGGLLPAVEAGRPALLLLAVGLAGLAQWRFLSVGAFDLLALLAALLAAPLITMASYGLPPAPLRLGPPRGGVPFLAPSWTRARNLALSASAVAAGAVLVGLAGAPSAAGYGMLALIWLAAVVLGIAALGGRPLLLRPRLTRAGLLGAVPLALIGLAALLLRAWQLGDIPATLSGDEGSQGIEAIKVLRGEITNPFTTGWLGVPTMSFYFNAPSIALLGNTAFALRIPWAIVGTATVLVSYFLVARLQGPLLGLLSAGFLAGFHYHIHFSRLGSNQVADTFFVALALLLLFRGYDRRDPLSWALCGATVGLAQYFYAGARFTAIVVVACVALLALRDGPRLWREHGRGLLALVWVSLVSAGPMIQYAFRFPNDFNARVNSVGIFQSGWLKLAQEISGTGPLPILVEQFWKAMLPYNAYADRTVWYGSPLPLFGLVEGALFILGLGYALLRLADRRVFPLVAWWGGALIIGGFLTENPPSLQRLISTAAPAAVFLCLGLVLALRGLWALLGRLDGPALRGGLGAATLALALLSARYYFVDYAPQRIYGGENAVIATSMADYALTRLGPDTRIVFFGPPRMYYGYGSIPYLLGQRAGVDVIEPLQAPPGPGLAARGDDVAFFFLPERLGELPLVQLVFPNGELEDVPSPTGGAPLYTVYRPAP
jgi:hypothetical protein